MTRRFVTLLATVVGLVACEQLPAQETKESRESRAPEAGEQRAPRKEGEPGRGESLTPEQQQTVKAILSKYNADSLTAADARAIHAAFRDAGLRGGPALNGAVEAAGFDPERLRVLVPPPGRGGGGDGHPREPGDDRRRERGDQAGKPPARDTARPQREANR